MYYHKCVLAPICADNQVRSSGHSIRMPLTYMYVCIIIAYIDWQPFLAVCSRILQKYWVCRAKMNYASSKIQSQIWYIFRIHGIPVYSLLEFTLFRALNKLVQNLWNVRLVCSLLGNMPNLLTEAQNWGLREYRIRTWVGTHYTQKATDDRGPLF